MHLRSFVSAFVAYRCLLALQNEQPMCIMGAPSASTAISGVQQVLNQTGIAHPIVSTDFSKNIEPPGKERESAERGLHLFYMGVRYHTHMKVLRGMSFVDVIVGTALVLIVFVALFGILRASLMISGVAKARAGATAIADTQVEYVRALDYDLVGTIGGIPAGVVAATSTQTLNGIAYNTRTLVVYVDDPADGLAGADTNGITTDYKQIKVEVTYTVRTTARTVSVISNYAPQSLETTTGGGTLTIAVVNAAGTAVAGATVGIVNNSTVPTVNFTTFSDATGLVQLPGAPTSTEYQVSVSKSGYSSATTYARDATNQNPTPGYLTVAANQTTTSTFGVDVLAPFTFRTLHPIAPDATTDTFADSTQLANQTNTQVAGGALVLGQTGPDYVLSGSARSVNIAPAYLSEWTSLNAALSVPVGTTARVQVVDGAGVLLPDSVLAGNSTGFSTFPVVLTGVSTTTYSALGLLADLTTTSSSVTPQILDWRMDYRVGPTPFPNVSFTLTGTKTKGTTGAGAPIYKTTVASTTNASGVFLSSLEWDVYSISIPGYTIDVASSTLTPFTIDPATSFEGTLILE